MSNGVPRDPDDFFAESRMSFGDHIEELRTHLWRAIYGFLLALVVSFFIGKYVMDWITKPVKDQLDRFYDRRIAKVLKDRQDELARLRKPSEFRKMYFRRAQLEAIARGEKVPSERPVRKTAEQIEEEESPPSWFARFFQRDTKAEKAPWLEDYKGKTVTITEENQDQELVAVWMSVDNPLFFSADGVGSLREIMQIDSPTTLRAEEAFFVWFKVCLVTGLVLGSPWIFWQIWMFVAAGLYPHEKKLVHYYLPISLFLFLAGVVICELFVIPKALEALLWFNEWLGIKPDIRLNDWLGFAIWMPVVFGLSFQTPLVMMFVNRLGLVDIDTFRGKRAYAWFGMALFAAVMTPSTDAFSMLFLWVPMSLLFEVGILMIKLSPADPSLEEETSEANELVEV